MDQAPKYPGGLAAYVAKVCIPGVRRFLSGVAPVFCLKLAVPLLKRRLMDQAVVLELQVPRGRCGLHRKGLQPPCMAFLLILCFVLSRVAVFLS